MKGLKDNSLQSVWRWFYESLKNKYPDYELKSVRKIFFEDVFDLMETDFVLKKDYRFTETEIVKIIKAINKLERYMPVQYITGKAFFLNNLFEVNENVLIPRPETEDLVLLAIKSIKNHFKNNKIVKILDVGTGSGCIGISLAKEIKNSVVHGIDNCREALETAKKNANNNEVEVSFKLLDILGSISFSESYDVIISNPPYVKDSEKQYMHKNVLNYEPSNALYIKDSEPLIFYNAICDKASKGLLTDNGLIFFEINEHHKDDVFNLLKQMGFTDIEVYNDFRSKPRFFKARKGLSTHQGRVKQVNKAK